MLQPFQEKNLSEQQFESYRGHSDFFDKFIEEPQISQEQINSLGNSAIAFKKFKVNLT